MARKLGVLVVDDQRSIRDLIKAILTDMGAEIRGEADNGVDAVEKFQQLAPDMVLMDINMPKMDGIQALKAIMVHNPKALVVMLTSQNTLATVQACLSIGARNFILKDSTPEEIKQSLKDSWVNYAKMMRPVA